MYLVGSSERGRIGGINQNYGANEWQEFLDKLPRLGCLTPLTLTLTLTLRLRLTPESYPHPNPNPTPTPNA